MSPPKNLQLYIWIISTQNFLETYIWCQYGRGLVVLYYKHCRMSNSYGNTTLLLMLWNVAPLQLVQIQAYMHHCSFRSTRHYNMCFEIHRTLFQEQLSSFRKWAVARALLAFHMLIFTDKSIYCQSQIMSWEISHSRSSAVWALGM